MLYAFFPSNELSNVCISKLQSLFKICLKSTTFPSTLAQVATLANPSLISFATSNTLFPDSNSLMLPSFNAILIIFIPPFLYFAPKRPGPFGTFFYAKKLL